MNTSNKQNNENELSSPNSSSNEERIILKSGWLLKKSHKTNSWKKKWFVVRGCRLTISKSEKSSSEYEINLKKAEWRFVNEEKYHFSIAIESGKRVHVMTAENSEELASWLNVLESVGMKSKMSSILPRSSSAPTPHRSVPSDDKLKKQTSTPQSQKTRRSLGSPSKTPTTSTTTTSSTTTAKTTTPSRHNFHKKLFLQSQPCPVCNTKVRTFAYICNKCFLAVHKNCQKSSQLPECCGSECSKNCKVSFNTQNENPSFKMQNEEPIPKSENLTTTKPNSNDKISRLNDSLSKSCDAIYSNSGSRRVRSVSGSDAVRFRRLFVETPSTTQRLEAIDELLPLAPKHPTKNDKQQKRRTIAFAPSSSELRKLRQAQSKHDIQQQQPQPQPQEQQFERFEPELRTDVLLKDFIHKRTESNLVRLLESGRAEELQRRVRQQEKSTMNSLLPLNETSQNDQKDFSTFSVLSIPNFEQSQPTEVKSVQNESKRSREIKEKKDDDR